MEGRYGNLFVGLSDRQLKQYYDSYRRVQVNKRREHEIFDDMISRYLDLIESEDESKKDIAAFAVARDHMLNVIARRYFKICDEFNDFEIHHDY